MSDFNPMVKTLPELPATTNLAENNLVWIHQESDTTDRRITLATLFANVYPMTPANATIVIGSTSKPFAEIHSTEVHVGSAVLSETANTLHMPNTTVDGDLTITGSFTVLGSAAQVNVEIITIQDNIIELNSNQTGNPPTGLRSGIEVNRGDAENYQFLFVEETSTFRIGEAGNTQAVATREDTPIHNGVAVWNNNTNRFEAKASFDGTIEAANRLATPRRISLGGPLSGYVDFNGTADVEIIASIANGDTHNHDTQYYPKAEADARYLELAKAETISNDLTITGTLHTVNIQGTTFSGNAGTASRLENDRQIALIGDVAGAQVFDGSSNIEIDVSVHDVTTDSIAAGHGHAHDDQYYTKALANSRFVNADGDSITGALNIDGTITATTLVGPLQGNADTASRWNRLMTLTLDGDLVGSVEFDGAANRILTAEIVNDSHSHDTQYYPRDEADNTFISISQIGENADIVQGNLTVSGQIAAQSGFVGSVTGNASTATKWANSQVVNITGGATGVLTLIGAEAPIDLTLTITDNSHTHVSANISDATAQAIVNTVVRRDNDSNFAANVITANTVVANITGNVTGNLTGNVTGNVTGNLTGNVVGNADTASALQISRNISLSNGATGSVSFNGSANVDIDVTVDRDKHNHDNIYFRQEDVYTKIVSDGRYPQFADVYERADAESTFVKQTGGDTIIGDLTVNGHINGTASKADKLTNSRQIAVDGEASGDIAFDGSANVTIPITIRSATGVSADGRYNFIIADNATVNGGLSVGQDLTIGGNLIVNGTTTTLNTTNLEIQDKTITLNAGATTWGVTDESGLEINRGGLAPYVIKVKNEEFQAGAGSNVFPVVLRQTTLTNNGMVIWNDSAKKIETATSGTEISATVSNAKLAEKATALASPQTLTFSGGVISGTAVIGDGTSGVTIPLTVGTVANATHAATAGNADTATRLAADKGISLSGAITASAVVFNGTSAIDISTALSTALENRIVAVEGKANTNATNITTNANSIGNNVTAIDNHNTRITTLENVNSEIRIAATESRLDAIYVSGSTPTGLLATAQMDIANLQSTRVIANAGIVGGTATLITYDAKGLVTGGANATTANIADSTDKRYVTDAQQALLGSTSGTNTGDETKATILDKIEYIPEDSTKKGVANGYAELDSSGRVPIARLPSYVDDVEEYASLSSLPATGELGKIYVALDTNIVYRWGGSEYVEISSSLALGITSSTAYRGDFGNAAYIHSQISTGNPHNTTAADISATGGTVQVVLDNKAGIDHTHAGVYEPVIAKNDAFNKSFGTAHTDVARGDHTHTQMDTNTSNITDLVARIAALEATVADMQANPTIRTSAPSSPDEGDIWIS